MRVHADSRHPDYQGYGNYHEIWLDGVRITRVVYADDEAGVVVCADPRDGRMYEQCLDDPFNTVRRYGRVTIINPRLLPVPVKRKVILMVVDASNIPLRSQRFIEMCHQARIDHEVRQLDECLQGKAPMGIFVDDWADAMDNAMRNVIRGAARKLEADAIASVGTRGPRGGIVKNDRAWDTKRRKGH